MKSCELCQRPARTYCESDQAILCWACDFKVHGANFLVARHSRTLLCHACHAPTPWKASGEKLGHTFSVCEICVARNQTRAENDEESQAGNDDTDDDDGDDVDEDQESDNSDYDDGDGDLDFDEEGENQVVPWSSPAPPPVSASCSSSEGANNDDRYDRRLIGAVSLKRNRDNSSCQDDLHRLSACTGESDGGEASVDCRRRSKDRRLDLNVSSPRISPVRSFRQIGRKFRGAVDSESSDEARLLG